MKRLLLAYLCSEALVGCNSVFGVDERTLDPAYGDATTKDTTTEASSDTILDTERVDTQTSDVDAAEDVDSGKTYFACGTTAAAPSCVEHEEFCRTRCPADGGPCTIDCVPLGKCSDASSTVKRCDCVLSITSVCGPSTSTPPTCTEDGWRVSVNCGPS